MKTNKKMNLNSTNMNSASKTNKTNKTNSASSNKQLEANSCDCKSNSYNER